MKINLYTWYGKTRVTSHELPVTSDKLKACQKQKLKFNSANWNPQFQIHELRIQQYELRVQIHELRAHTHELPVQVHEFKNHIVNEKSL